jgi:hypothetical protein
MTQKDKELLLLKDLCARLPYGVKCHFKYGSAECDVTLDCIDNGVARFEYGWYGRVHVSIDADYIKPYLRPMSSMTEEEKEELKSKCIHTETEEDWDGVRCDVWGIQILDKYDTRRWDNPIWPSTINMDAIDWLNVHHFDYRGLIEKGLAIEAPEGMYK